jgi:hypothetical protein
MEKLTAENYSKGFLMDEELMAGISEDKANPGTFHAFVVRHTTGESLGHQLFSDVFEAIRTLNGIERNWSFEAVSKCGNGNCGNGNCGKSGGGCGRSKANSEKPQDSCESGACS